MGGWSGGAPGQADHRCRLLLLLSDGHYHTDDSPPSPPRTAPFTGVDCLCRVGFAPPRIPFRFMGMGYLSLLSVAPSRCQPSRLFVMDHPFLHRLPPFLPPCLPPSFPWLIGEGCLSVSCLSLPCVLSCLFLSGSGISLSCLPPCSVIITYSSAADASVLPQAPENVLISPFLFPPIPSPLHHHYNYHSYPIFLL